MKHLSCAVLAVAIAAAGCATTGDTTPMEPTAVAPSERWVHTPDLAPLIKRFLSPQGFMDTAFPPTVAKPSAYYSDFYGLQAISDVSRETIERDLVPKLARKTAEDEHSITLRFPKGYTAKFYPVSTLSVMGVSVPISQVEISGDDWRSLGANLSDFRAVLDRAGLTKRYLVPNPYVADEELVYKQLQSGRHAPITLDPSLARFGATKDGVLLIGEAVHGKPEDVTKAIEVIKTAPVAWIGLEMLPVEQQGDIDAFNNARKGTPEYDAARAKMVEYFAQAWNGRAGPKTTGEENLYFKLVDAAHDRGTRVIALEKTSLPFLLFRYGETTFGAAVRSSWWADQIPATGRGIIFGGKAHFTEKEPINAQDFIVAQQPRRPIFSLSLIEPRK